MGWIIDHDRRDRRARAIPAERILGDTGRRRDQIAVKCSGRRLMRVYTYWYECILGCV